MADQPLPIIRPTLPPLDEVAALLSESWDSGVVTVGRLVRELEQGTGCALD